MKIHFCGIKGTGMAALAQILSDQGHDVSGSDIPKYIFTQDELEARNIPVLVFDPENIRDQDLVIAGLSFTEDHPELQEARKKGIRILWYNDFLGEFLRDFHSVCVAGCHGKSTTTGMLGAIFEAHGPSGFLIGDGHGHLDQESPVFILESCEFRRHFLSYHPDEAIITNIELDHMDYYRDLDDYMDAFQTFAGQVRKKAFINGDDPLCLSLRFDVPVRTFGFSESCDYRIVSLRQGTDGLDYDLEKDGKIIGHVHLRQTGKGYAYDSAAAFALASEYGIPAAVIEEALCQYRGIHRRFEERKVAGSILVDDYAHHPTAVSMMIDAVRSKYPGLPVIALYKPDRYSRVQYFLDGFAKALNEADEAILFDFPENAVRESEEIDVTIDDLLEKLDNGSLLKVDRESAEILAEKGPAVFLFMSSKDIYLLRDYLEEVLSQG